MIDLIRFPSGVYVSVDEIRYLRCVNIKYGTRWLIGLKTKEDDNYLSIGRKEEYLSKEEAQVELDVIFEEVCKKFSK